MENCLAEVQEWRRLLVSSALAIPVVALAMIPALQFRNWQWACLALASPVAVWGRGRSTVPPSSMPGTVPRPWTRWCRSG